MKFSRSIMLPLAGFAVIAALSGCGSSANPLGVQPVDTTPPPAPLNLSLSADGSGNPVLTWDASAAPDVVGYQVQVFSAASGSYVQAADANATDTTYPLPGVNVQASYRVRAVDDSGNWSAFSATVDISTLPPSGPGSWGPGSDGSPQILRTE